jgi:hypothetical protein
MCPACLAIAGLVAVVMRPWAARRRERLAADAARWRLEAVD